jgi:hypothetical protein
MPHTLLNTAGTTTFGQTLSGNVLFTLNADIPAADALEHASILQDCANKLIFESALGSHDPTRHLALSALYLGEMAKAIMDDVARSLETPA